MIEILLWILCCFVVACFAGIVSLFLGLHLSSTKSDDDYIRACNMRKLQHENRRLRHLLKILLLCITNLTKN